MDSGFYAAYTGLLARTEALDSAASNLANVEHHRLSRRAGVFSRRDPRA